MRRVLCALGIVVLPALVACGISGTEPRTQSSAQPEAVALPNLIGVPAIDAERMIENILPNATAWTDPADPTYYYGVENRCLWTDPSGESSDKDRWPVASIVIVLHPDRPAGTSPTEPVQPGPPRSFGKLDSPFFELEIEKPSDVWCKPYDAGDSGVAPNVDVPNGDDDGGESWFCRRRRWC